jgi:signal transduction histidine kinase/DNA-binding NarL/FixJ family response regulator
MDLLTRGAGFGYIGSTITSLIYACFTFILFAVEATIMSQAISLCLSIPIAIAHVISALLVLPIAAYGIRLISRFQFWTQPVWLILQFAPLVYVGFGGLHDVKGWTHYPGIPGEGGGSLSLLTFGMAASVLLSFLPQIGEQVDYLRFLPEKTAANRLGWWSALLVAGPGWIIIGCGKILAGSFLAYVALAHGTTDEQAMQPTELYRIAFSQLVDSPGLVLALTGLFVVTCQTKINVTNAYAGSIAWSNFFSRLTHSHPGRVVWLTFNVLLALMLMEVGIFRVVDSILALYANFAVAWIGALTADLVVSKPLGWSPPTIEFRRAHLYNINPVGVGAMALSLLVSTAALFDCFGAQVRAVGPLIGFAISFVAAPLIARATKGRYYIARQPEPGAAERGEERCIICEHHFEANDMAHCPAYGGAICSLCCSLDMRCHDRCKDSPRLADLLTPLAALVPAPVRRVATSRLGRFLGVLTIMVIGVGGLLALVYDQYSAMPGADAPTIRTTLLIVFAGLLVAMGLVAWTIVLVSESRRMAEQETDRQTAMLMDEIEAHQRTDAALQKAKEVAEAANHAKTRFIAGLNHEIRTLLNSINGYAQLLERNATRRPEDAVRVIRRSAGHITNLMDELLDISRVESGTLRLYRNVVDIGEFLDQLVDIFRLQANAKGIGFDHRRSPHLPRYIHADEKRLRQILMNLLSNAVKYTERGQAALDVRYRSQIAEFVISDTGLGIEPDDAERIFLPFERGRNVATATSGTGLGLTIARLLTQVLGGDLTVSSEPGKGSTFRVKLLLTEALEPPRHDAALRQIRGYRGQPRIILIADDDAAHVNLVREILEPLGFILFAAKDGPSCLAMAESCQPHLAMLDISMPLLDGWEVARRLRAAGRTDLPILMVSADALELSAPRRLDMPHDDYLVKPFEIAHLLERIHTLLDLDWLYVEEEDAGSPPVLPATIAPHHVASLRHLCGIGHLHGIDTKLAEIEAEHPDAAPLLATLRQLAETFAFDRLRQTLDDLGRHDP